MIATAHVLAILCYLGAVALAAAPFARPMTAPVRGVTALLGLGVVSHVAGFTRLAMLFGYASLTGIGPALSFGGLLLAATLLAAEWMAGDVSLTLLAAPLAAAAVTAATISGFVPEHVEAAGVRDVWLVSHIALSFAGIAAFATAAAAGAVYLLERRELKSRRFGAIFRFFPPLETLDRVNHVASIAGWLLLTLGVVLAGSYAVTYQETDAPKLIWALAAWFSVTALTLGRLAGWWRAQRAATLASVSFTAVLALYVAFRVALGTGGKFL
jgi:ABC-type uncharacterized transport system permease subunit